MFFAIPNQVANTTFQIAEPWTYAVTAPPPYENGKDAVGRYGQSATTKHAYISGFEGVTAEVRISEKAGNPCYRMHALIVDYDNPIPADVVNVIRKRAPCEHLPNYVCRTGSGNSRLVWLFETPFRPVNDNHLRAFLVMLSRTLCLTKWLGRYDVAALSNPATYYDIGVEWTPVAPDALIPTALLQFWAIKSGLTVNLDTKKVEYEIPLEEVAMEVEKQFPGRWKGEFTLGSRGVRFWTDEGTNPTAAVVCSNGMLCFSDDEGQMFFPWRQLLGKDYCEKYEASTYAHLLDKMAFCRDTFFTEEDRNGHPRWIPVSKDDFKQDLRVLGYDSRNLKGESYSEQDVIMRSIRTQCRVDYAAPMLFYPPGIVRYSNRTILNLTQTWALDPAPPLSDGPMSFQAGRSHFPKLFQFMRTLFVNDETEESEQLTALLAWMKHAYANAFYRTPRAGQVIVLAGPVGKGKTMFGKKIMGPLLGGEKDASSHLVEGNKWTDDLADCPLLRIDDDLVTGGDRSRIVQFTARLKKYAANSEMPFAAKYRDETTIPWRGGRIIVTCNLDAESLRILPDMNLSNLDKVSLFKASDHREKFPTEAEWEAIIRRELPSFARFLLDWEIPEQWVAEESRFGVVPYHHPDMINASRQQGLGLIIELLTRFMEAVKADGKEYWKGTAVELYELLCSMSGNVMREMKVHYLPTQLGKLESNGFNVAKVWDDGMQAFKWRIGVDLNGTRD